MNIVIYMVKRSWFWFFILIGLFFVFFPAFSFATRTGCPTTGLVPCGTPGCPCTFCDFFVMIDRILDFLFFRIVPVLAALMVAIGGVVYITSPANSEMFSLAKRIFTSVGYGLLIIYSAFLIIGVFLWLIGLSSWTKDIYRNWWKEGFFTIKCEDKPSQWPQPSPSPGPKNGIGKPVLTIVCYQIDDDEISFRGKVINCASKDVIVGIDVKSGDGKNKVSAKKDYYLEPRHYCEFYTDKEDKSKIGSHFIVVLTDPTDPGAPPITFGPFEISENFHCFQSAVQCP